MSTIINTKMSKNEKLILNLERITGFKTTSDIDNDINIIANSYFMLVYCLRNENKISTWFSQQGSFDTCDNVLNIISELGLNTRVYTILFEIDNESKKAIRVIKEIITDDHYGTQYDNMLNLADDLKPFVVDDYIK